MGGAVATMGFVARGGTFAARAANPTSAHARDGLVVDGVCFEGICF